MRESFTPMSYDNKCSPKCGRYDKLILAIFLIVLAILIIKL